MAGAGPGRRSLVWLLRGGSLAASAAGARRTVRGAKWYDGPQLLLASPWHVVQAIPGALLLLLWSLGLALACGAGLLRRSRPAMQVTLFACGVVLGRRRCGWGPGGSRLRGPVNRGSSTRCRGRWRRGWSPWVLVVAGGDRRWASLADPAGTDWAPLGVAAVAAG